MWESCAGFLRIKWDPSATQVKGLHWAHWAGFSEIDFHRVKHIKNHVRLVRLSEKSNLGITVSRDSRGNRRADRAPNCFSQELWLLIIKFAWMTVDNWEYLIPLTMQRLQKRDEALWRAASSSKTETPDEANSSQWCSEGRQVAKVHCSSCDEVSNYIFICLLFIRDRCFTWSLLYFSRELQSSTGHSVKVQTDQLNSKIVVGLSPPSTDCLSTC